MSTDFSPLQGPSETRNRRAPARQRRDLLPGFSFASCGDCSTNESYNRGVDGFRDAARRFAKGQAPSDPRLVRPTWTTFPATSSASKLYAAALFAAGAKRIASVSSSRSSPAARLASRFPYLAMSTTYRPEDCDTEKGTSLNHKKGSRHLCKG